MLTENYPTNEQSLKAKFTVCTVSFVSFVSLYFHGVYMNRDSKEVAYSQINILMFDRYDISQEDYKSKWKIVRLQLMREQALERKKEVQSTNKRCLPLLLEVVQDAEVYYCAQCYKGI